MQYYKLDLYWQDIPVGRENAVSYADLTAKWSDSERVVRQILHDLSAYDNGDDYVLIRSARTKGFYRTDDIEEIKTYRQECLNKGRSLFAPIKKINRVINTNSTQFTIENNLRVIRESRGLKQSEVCKEMKRFDTAIDKSMLSKMENNVCLPTYQQALHLAEIYQCDVSFLINYDCFC